ncbi:Tip elongation aberrant protein 1, partial [Neolecta irregularis DAH-3]
TNGDRYFNDTWLFDARTRAWSQLDCLGYVPSAREGHSACMVGDVIYIFGGRGPDRRELGDLCALRITNRRWYTFQNMGPSPSGRSGHSLTTVRENVIVLGGEGATSRPEENNCAFILDTTKIRYPVDNSTQQTQQPPGGSIQPRSTSMRGPSSSPSSSHRESPPQSHLSDSSPPSRLPQKFGNGTPPSRREGDSAPSPTEYRSGSAASSLQGIQQHQGGLLNAQQGPVSGHYGNVSRSASSQHRSPRPMVESNTRPRTASAGSSSSSTNQTITQIPLASASRMQSPPPDRRTPNGQTPPQLIQRAFSPIREEDNGIMNSNEINSHLGKMTTLPDLTIALSSQNSKPPEDLRRSNRWFQAELDLARKQGYMLQNNDLKDLISEATPVSEDMQKMYETLFAMRAEVIKVKEQIAEQSTLASLQIEEFKRQRDVALQEAAYAKARLSASPQADKIEGDRSAEFQKKLAASAQSQQALEHQLANLKEQIEVEKKHRLTAESQLESTNERFLRADEIRERVVSESQVAQVRTSDLEHELLQLKEYKITIEGKLEALKIEYSEIKGSLDRYEEQMDENTTAIQGAKAAVIALTARSEETELSLTKVTAEKEEVENNLAVLQAHLTDQQRDSTKSLQRITDLEAQLKRSRAEAETARAAMLSGMDKYIDHRQNSRSTSVNTEGRLSALQEQLDAVKQLQTSTCRELEQAKNELTSSLARVAQLEDLQGKSGRETVLVQKKLSETLAQLSVAREHNISLKTKNAELQRDLEAAQIKQNALRQVMAERQRSKSSSPSAARSETPTKVVDDGIATLTGDSNDLAIAQRRVAEAEKKLAESTDNFNERLKQLEQDYESAVHYVKGTEKMLRRMKEEHQKLKSKNTDLMKELEDTTIRGENLQKQHEKFEVQVGDLEDQIEHLEQERTALRSQLVELQKSIIRTNEEYSAKIRTLEIQLEKSKTTNGTSKSTLETQLQESRTQQKRLEIENAALEKKVLEAEQKVSLLLDQMESSVDAYRQSFVGGSSLAIPAEDFPNPPNSANRTSRALDSLASELDALRSHWENTHKNRISNASSTMRMVEYEDYDDDFESKNRFSDSLAEWRQGLNFSGKCSPVIVQGERK